MSSAAIFLHPEAFDTSGARLMGRHSAGESFLRGFIRHGAGDRIYAYNPADRRPSELQQLVGRIEPSAKSLHVISPRNPPAIAEAGCLYCPSPELPSLAYVRQPFGAGRYSICGVTHTTATKRAMDIIADFSTSFVQPWDGLICTSAAVRASVEWQLDAVEEMLVARLGAAHVPRPALTTIPLGINAADFRPLAESRKSWRERLDIPQDAIVALYVGRFNSAAKMNPAMMALTLEAAAQRTGKTIYWVVSGWGPSEEYTKLYHAETRALCPSIQYRELDGRPADTRFSIWSAADFFVSFSDNIQETYGLTPVEALAAGLPCVVSDWDGYRDTVRHGIDGFQVTTYAPRAGIGRDLAFAHANDWISYETYIAAASQMTTIDYQEAVTAVTALVEDADLRARMSAAALDSAARRFDWSVIIPEYEAFWSELDAIRAASADRKDDRALTMDNPRRPDPFTLFAGYPSRTFGPETLVTLTEGMDWTLAKPRLSTPFATAAGQLLPSQQDVERIIGFLSQNDVASAAQITAQFPAGRSAFIERGLLWLAKYGIVRLG